MGARQVGGKGLAVGNGLARAQHAGAARDQGAHPVEQRKVEAEQHLVHEDRRLAQGQAVAYPAGEQAQALAPDLHALGIARAARGEHDVGQRFFAQPLQEKSLAYIMFTSGSTGDPKGVQIGRESLGLFAGWIRDCLALGEAPVFMDQMLFSFDFSLFNWMGALVTGGACVLCARETIADRQAFAAYLAGTHVNVWASTPSDRKSTRLNSSHSQISYAVFCLKKKKTKDAAV